MPVAVTGTRRPLKAKRPLLVVVARGVVAMLSRYNATCSPGVKPSPERLYAAPAGPLSADAVRCGAVGQTASSARAVAPPAPEAACTISARVTPRGMVTVVFRVPSAPLRTVPSAHPFGLSLLPSTSRTSSWAGKPEPDREMRPPGRTRGGVATSTGMRELADGACWRAGAL